MHSHNKLLYYGLILSCAIAALVSNAHVSKCPKYLISTVLIKCLHTVVVGFRLQRLQCFLILNKFSTLNTTVQV